MAVPTTFAAKASDASLNLFSVHGRSHAPASASAKVFSASATRVAAALSICTNSFFYISGVPGQILRHLPQLTDQVVEPLTPGDFLSHAGRVIPRDAIGDHPSVFASCPDIVRSVASRLAVGSFAFEVLLVETATAGGQDGLHCSKQVTQRHRTSLLLYR